MSLFDDLKEAQEAFESFFTSETPVAAEAAKDATPEPTVVIDVEGAAVEP